MIRKFTGFYNIPIIAIVIAALFSRHRSHAVPAGGALAAIGFHLPVYGLLTFVIDTGIHFIHLYALLFACELAIMAGFARWRPAAVQQPLREPDVDLTPWRYTPVTCVLLLGAMVGLYALFSPLGLAS